MCLSLVSRRRSRQVRKDLGLDVRKVWLARAAQVSAGLEGSGLHA